MSAWRDRLASLSAEKAGEGPNDELTKLTEPGFVSFGGVRNGPRGEISTDPLPRLLGIAASEGVDLDVVHGLGKADLAACAGEPEETLLAYVRALRRNVDLATGVVPAGWSETVNCHGCGPVYLWPGCPTHVIACPWCRHRNAGTAIPTPPPSPTLQEAHEHGNHEPA